MSFKRRNYGEENKVGNDPYNAMKNKGMYSDDYDVNSHAFKKINFTKTFN